MAIFFMLAAAIIALVATQMVDKWLKDHLQYLYLQLNLRKTA